MEYDARIGGVDLRTHGWHVTDKIIEAPEIKTHTVDIPGRDGVLDFTSYLRGYAIYGNRKITVDIARDGGAAAFASAQSNLLNMFHGRKLDIIFSDDPNWMYQGRVSVGPVALEGQVMKCQLYIDADPYKMSVQNTKATTATLTGNRFGATLPQGVYSGFFTGLSQGHIYIPCLKKNVNDGKRTVTRLNIYGDQGRGTVLFNAELYGNEDYAYEGRVLTPDSNGRIQFSMLMYADIAAGESYSASMTLGLKEGML